MDVDHEEILTLPEGIYRVKYYRLSVKSIRNLRSRWMSDVFKLRREIGELTRNIARKRKNIEQKEAIINKFTEENIQKLMEVERAKQKQIDEKANEFLRKTIGEVAFAELETKGEFCFIGLDGKEYRIKKNGELQVSDTTYWYHCCYMRPTDLPLPDIIASVFNTVKNRKRFSSETRLTKTKEEVT